MANDVRSFQLSLKKFGEDQPKVLSKLMRRAAISIFGDLVKGSPVDTGRFRASWFVGIGTPDRSVVSEHQIGPGGHSGEKKKARDKRVRTNTGPATAESMSRLSLLTPETVDGKEPIIISNNLPYATALADGHSDQAPSGWVKAAVNRAQRELDVVKVK